MCTHFSKNPSSELLESLKFTTKKKTLPIGEIEKNSTTTIWKIYITNQSSYPWMEFELWTSIISSWLTTVLRRKAKAPKKKKKKKRGEREELGREQGKEKLNNRLAESEQLLTCWLRLVAVNTECTWMCRVTSSWYPRKQVHYEGHWELAAHQTMPVLHPLETHTISFPMSIIVTKNPSFFGPSSPKSQTGCVVCSHQETNATSKQAKWCQNL